MIPPGLQALIIVACVMTIGVMALVFFREVDCTSILGTTVCR